MSLNVQMVCQLPHLYFYHKNSLYTITLNTFKLEISVVLINLSYSVVASNITPLILKSTYLSALYYKFVLYHSQIITHNNRK